MRFAQHSSRTVGRPEEEVDEAGRGFTVPTFRHRVRRDLRSWLATGGVGGKWGAAAARLRGRAHRARRAAEAVETADAGHTRAPALARASGVRTATARTNPARRDRRGARDRVAAEVRNARPVIAAARG